MLLRLGASEQGPWLLSLDHSGVVAEIGELAASPVPGGRHRRRLGQRLGLAIAKALQANGLAAVKVSSLTKSGRYRPADCWPRSLRRDEHRSACTALEAPADDKSLLTISSEVEGFFGKPCF